MLLEQGVNSLPDLAARDPELLAEALAAYGEQHREIAAELVAQARVQASGLPQRLGRGPVLPELATAPGVLLYDIESDPDARDDFLHGFVVLESDGAGGWLEHSARYQPLLALQGHG